MLIDNNYIENLKKNNITFDLVQEQLKVLAPEGVLKGELLESIKAKKEEIIIYLKELIERKNFRRVLHVEKKEYYAASSAQKRFYYLQQLNPESLAYNMVKVLPFDFLLDYEQLKHICAKLIEKHSVLRSSFIINQGKIVQKIHDDVKLNIECKLLAREELEINIKNSLTAFDLFCGPLIAFNLFHIGSSKSFLVINSHHIINDAKSFDIIVNNLVSLFKNEKLAKQKYQYADFSEWQAQNRNSKILDSQKKYWHQLLSGDLNRLELPQQGNRADYNGTVGEVLVSKLSTVRINGVNSIASKNMVTPFSVLLTVFKVLLSKISSQKDLIIGIPSLGRNPTCFQNVVGLFINTLVIRSCVSKNKTFDIYLKEIGQQIATAIENQDYQYEDLVNHLGLSHGKLDNQLFNVLFNYIQVNTTIDYENNDIPIAENNELEDFFYKEKSVKFDINLKTIQKGSQFLINLEYNKIKYSREFGIKFLEYFNRLIDQLIIDSKRSIIDLKIISNESHNEKIKKINRPLVLQSNNQYLQEELNKVFEQNRDNIAINHKDFNLTYDELDRRSTIIANAIISLGYKKQTLVGIYTSDHSNRIISIIGILKAGCVFVPIDKKLPENRIGKMLKHLSLKIILTDKFGAGVILRVDFKIKLLDFNSLNYNAKAELDVSIDYKFDDKVYIYFTSGSTGHPNAIVGKNIGLLHFAEWEIETFGVDQSYNIAQLTNEGFDVYLRDIFVPLLSGSKICIPTNEFLFQESNKFLTWINSQEINLIHCVPSLFKVFNYKEDKLNDLRSLKHILLAGEQPVIEDLRLFNRLFGDRIQLINLYGPTETTLAKIYHIISKDNIDEGHIPVGKAIEGSEFILLDNDLNICDDGLRGEVYIRTPYRTFGYCNNVEMTCNKFIKNPFLDGNNDFLYKTGDLGLVDKNGLLVLKGRKDNQIKISGVRIEVDEIQNEILNYSSINEVCIIVNRKTKNQLFAYYTAKEDISGKELRQYLSTRLVKEMIPAFYFQLKKMPLNINGKVDRKKLAEIENLSLVRKEVKSARNDYEEKLVKIWSEVIGCNPKQINIDDNFFDLGGNSLNVIKVTKEIEKVFKVSFPINEFVQTPIIEKISRKIIKASFKGNNCVELLNNKKDKNVFCFPPASAHNIFYQRFLPFFEDYAIYGITFTYSENLIEKYCQFIREKQSNGPFCFLAYSAGGVFAYEVIKAIEQQGEIVSDLILIDANVKKQIRTEEQWESFNRYINGASKIISDFGLSEYEEEFIENIREYAAFRENTITKGTISSNIHFIREANDNSRFSELKNWRLFTSGKFIEYEGHGIHGDMFNNENIFDNLTIIKRILDSI